MYILNILPQYWLTIMNKMGCHVFAMQQVWDTIPNNQAAHSHIPCS